jgi:hypothetical protein
LVEKEKEGEGWRDHMSLIFHTFMSGQKTDRGKMRENETFIKPDQMCGSCSALRQVIQCFVNLYLGAWGHHQWIGFLIFVGGATSI